MTDEKYTERDIEIAEKIGGLTTMIQGMDDKLNRVLQDKDVVHNAIWKKIDLHTDKISKLDGAFKWIIGIGLGFQAAWGFLMVWMKRH